MSFKMTFNGVGEINVSRFTLTGGIRAHAGRTAAASGLSPTVLEIEREMNILPSNDFFNAAVASPDTANEVTLECDMDVRNGTAYTATVEEGTVVGWQLFQESPDAPVMEVTTVFARKAELACGSETADLTLVTSK